MSETRTQSTYNEARMRMPGGTQLLSKRPELHLPGSWPAYYSRTQGVDVWDLDNRHYIDMCYNGIGTCILGACDPDVDAAVHAAIDNGNMSTLNCPEEVELAELLCELHPWAERVRYGRSGGEAMAIAVRIARAATGREKIAFCGYHGWHDWYLAANLADEQNLDGHLLPGLSPAGVPRGLQGTAMPFRYNHLDELDEIIAQCDGNLAAIVMEPIRNIYPIEGFIAGVRERASRLGAVLLVDEITAGFRLNCGGAHMVLDLLPDMAVFGKGMSNGYPMAAIIGRDTIMDAAQKTFISSTYWTDRIGPSAAISTIRKHKTNSVHEHLHRIGSRVQEGWRHAAAAAVLPLHVGGIAPLGHFAIEHSESQAGRTHFTQLMLERGYLASGAFYATFAHNDTHVDRYLDAVGEVFSLVATSLRDGTVEQKLNGPVAHSGFRRLT